MALNIGDLYVQIGADTKQLESAVFKFSGLERAIDNLAKSVESLNKMLGDTYSKIKTSTEFSAVAVEKSAKRQVDAEKQRNAQIEAINKARIQQAIAVNKKITAEQKVVFSAFKASAKDYQTTAKQSAQAFVEAFAAHGRHGIASPADINHLKEFANAFVVVGGKADGASRHLSAVTSKSRNMGLAAQNAAYQLQDMIVQFELGIPASRVLGQQLPQLLGGFGVMGAVAGVVAAGLAMLIPKLISSSDEAEEATRKVDRYKESLNTLKSITDGLEEAQSRLNGTMRNFELRSLRQVVVDAENDVAKIKENLKSISFEAVGGFAPSYQSLLESNTKLKDAVESLREAREREKEAQEGQVRTTMFNLSTDIDQTRQILEKAKAYKAGALSEKEYRIEKDLILERDRLGIQQDEKAIQVLRILLGLKAELAELEKKGPKKDPVDTSNVMKQVRDLQTQLERARELSKTIHSDGVNAGEALKQQFKNADDITKYADAFNSMKPEEKVVAAKMLGVSVDQVAVSMAKMATETRNVNDGLSYYSSLIERTSALSDKVTVNRAGGSFISNMFGFDNTAQKDLVRRTNEIKKKLESEMAKGADDFYLTEVVDEYTKVAKEAGMENPFANIDVTNVNAVATAVAKVEQNVDNLGKSSGNIRTHLVGVMNQLSSIFSQMTSMYSEMASYHARMAQEALNNGRTQAETWMELADAVHYSNNEQAQSFEQKAVIAAEAAAKQYQEEQKLRAKNNAAAKKAFENQKKMQIAQTIMTTAMAAMQAFSSMAGIPYVGPVLGAAAAAAVAALGAAQVNLISQQQYTPREKGGPITGGKPYLVGEKGPELIIPGKGGSVVNNDDLMDGIGGGNVTVLFNVQAHDASGFDRLLSSRRGMIINMLKDATNQNMRRSPV